MHEPTSSPLQTDPGDDAAVARVLRAVSGLAHSLAVQIAASAAVTLAVATIPWLHESAAPPAPASVAAQPAAAGPAAAPSALALAGIVPAAAFPMEGDARFGLALHRTYRVVADATWSDGSPVDTAQQASPPRPSKRRAVAQDGAGEASPAQQGATSWTTVAVLPPERPPELRTASATLRPVDEADVPPSRVPEGGLRPAGGPTRVAGLELPLVSSLPLPPLPSIRQVSSEIGTRAAEARDALERTASWAADGVSNALPRF